MHSRNAIPDLSERLQQVRANARVARSAGQHTPFLHRLAQPEPRIFSRVCLAMSSRSNRGFHSQECKCRKLTRQVPVNVRKRGNGAKNNARNNARAGEVNGGVNRSFARMRLKKAAFVGSKARKQKYPAPR